MRLEREMNEKLLYLDVIIQWFKPIMISLLGSASGLIFGTSNKVPLKLAAKYIAFAVITSAPSYYIALQYFDNDTWIAGSICFIVSAFGFWLFRFIMATIKLPNKDLIAILTTLITRKK